jgi:hypothetical protein
VTKKSYIQITIVTLICFTVAGCFSLFFRDNSQIKREVVKEDNQNVMFQLWIATAQDGISALINPSDFPNDTLESFSKNNQKFPKVQEIIVTAPRTYNILDTYKATNQNRFFATARGEADTFYALDIDVEERSVQEFFSSHDYPNFKNPKLSSANHEGSAVLFLSFSCVDCMESTITRFISFADGRNQSLGQVALFEWISEGGYRYKSTPFGCEGYFSMLPRDVAKADMCENLIQDALWTNG